MRKFGVVFVLLVALAACGGDDASPDGAPAADSDDTTADMNAGEAADAADEAATTDEPAVAEVTVDPCELVTTDDVEAATGLLVVTVDATTLDPTGCVFEFGLTADVFVQTGSLAEFMFTNYMDVVNGGTAELIPDVGEAAVYAASFRGLAVDAGQGRFVAVGLNGGYPEELAETRDVLVALASAAAARL